MALVNQCDICKKVYDRYPSEINMVINIKEGRESELTKICCPECTSKLSEFIDTLASPDVNNVIIDNEQEGETLTDESN